MAYAYENVTMRRNGYTGTWNVYVGAEWYYEGTYDKCCEVVDELNRDYDEEDRNYDNDPY